MASRPFTEATVRALKPKKQPYKLSDGGGLHLLVTAAGTKIWRLSYRDSGRQQCVTIGPYPVITLAAARRYREERKLGLHVVQTASPPAAGKTFKEVALEWHAAQDERWTPKFARQILIRLKTDLFPDLGDRPLRSIARAELLATLRKVESRGALETARRIRQYAGAIFRFAGATDDLITDPTPMLRDAMKAPPRPKHLAALKSGDIGPFLRDLDAYTGEPTTRLGILLILHTVVRTSEFIPARWTEFEHCDDPARALWRIPGARMKMDTEHLVPLSPQALEILSALRQLTGKGTYLFPAANGGSGHMSNNTMLYGLYRMGYRHKTTIHGFRRTFSTEANEHGWPSDHIEMQLSHDERDEVRGAYNAAQYLPGRRELMHWWSERLDAVKENT